MRTMSWRERRNQRSSQSAARHPDSTNSHFLNVRQDSESMLVEEPKTEVALVSQAALPQSSANFCQEVPQNDLRLIQQSVKKLSLQENLTFNNFDPNSY